MGILSKLALVGLGLLATVNGAMFAEHDYQQAFGSFVKEHKKAYAHDQFFYRYTVFKNAMDYIHNHNTKGNSTYTLAINEFADQTSEEFVHIHNGYKNKDDSFARSKNAPVQLLGARKAPTSIDWRQKGAVTAVKNQQQCGSCWAFSTTGSTEGCSAIASGNLIALSEQQLVDCSQAQGNQGCEGGLMDQGFQYIITNGGITSEANYPYTAADGTCMSPLPASVASVTGFQDVPSGDENSLLTAVGLGPVSIAIEADSQAFQYYSGGVFSDPTCGTNLDHGVLIVGYGTDPAQNQPYWIVKNSWGASWGEAGYIRLIRGENMCGLAQQPSYPTGCSEPKAL